MRLLLDTHFVVDLTDGEPAFLSRVKPADELFASVVNLWEIAIKHRLGKLKMSVMPVQIPRMLESGGVRIIDISRDHVLEELGVVPPTRDPFDRLLLAQCQVERMKLVTLDDKMTDHPLAWKPV